MSSKVSETSHRYITVQTEVGHTPVGHKVNICWSTKHVSVFITHNVQYNSDISTINKIYTERWGKGWLLSCTFFLDDYEGRGYLFLGLWHCAENRNGVTSVNKEQFLSLLTQNMLSTLSLNIDKQTLLFPSIYIRQSPQSYIYVICFFQVQSNKSGYTI